MKDTLTILLVLALLATGCTVWVQAAGRNATSTQTGNNEDNSRSADPSRTSSEPQKAN